MHSPRSKTDAETHKPSHRRRRAASIAPAFNFAVTSISRTRQPSMPLSSWKHSLMTGDSLSYGTSFFTDFPHQCHQMPCRGEFRVSNNRKYREHRIPVNVHEQHLPSRITSGRSALVSQTVMQRSEGHIGFRERNIQPRLMSKSGTRGNASGRASAKRNASRRADRGRGDVEMAFSPSVLLHGSDSAKRQFLNSLRSGESTMTIESCNDILSSLVKLRRTRDAMGLVRIWEQKPFLDLLISVKAVKTFTIMIDVCGKSQQLAHCFSLFHTMGRAGVRPNLITYNSLIAACARSNEPEMAYRVFQEMETKGLEPDKFSYGSLIDSCAKSGKVDRAFEISRMMDGKDIHKDQTVYSALMDACGRAKQLDRALMVFEEMKRNAVWPNLVTFSVLIDTCANVRQPERAFQLFSEIKHWGFRRANVVVYTALIDACSKAGWPDRGELVMKSMLENGIRPNEISFGALMEGWTREGHIDQAFEILERMVRDHSLRPNSVLIGGIIDACRRFRDVGRVKSIWTIVVKYNIRPSRSYYPSLICMAAQNGDLDILSAIAMHAYARGFWRRVALNSESPTARAMACALRFLMHVMETEAAHSDEARQYLERLRVVLNSSAMRTEDMASVSPAAAFEHCMTWNNYESTSAFSSGNAVAYRERARLEAAGTWRTRGSIKNSAASEAD